MLSRSITISTTLSPEECVARLQRITDPPGVDDGDRPLIGTVAFDSCSLRYRLGYRNDLQRKLNLTISPSGTGSTLIGNLAPPASALLACLLISVASALVVGVTASNLPPINPRLANLPYLAPTLVVLLMVLLIAISLGLGRSSEDQLLAAVTQAVHGKSTTGTTN